jgi:hypothetical protein
MKSEFRKSYLILSAVCIGLYLSMLYGLAFLFDENVAGLLAAAATWSLAVLGSVWGSQLSWRYGFYRVSSLPVLMAVFHLAPLVVGAKPHVLVPIVVVVLVLPMLAITTLLERIVFSEEERRQITEERLRAGQRTRVE